MRGVENMEIIQALFGGGGGGEGARKEWRR